MLKTLRLPLVISLLAFSLPMAAHAATFTYAGTFEGNECQGFDGCTLGGSPVIAKFEYDDGVADGNELNTDVFGSIDGTEFIIGFDDGSDNSGKWSYSPAGADPVVITSFVVKSGNENSGGGYSVYTWDSDSGTDYTNIFWDTSTLGDKALSHITFFDTGLSEVPLPAAGWMLLAGIAGMAGLKRRK